MNASAIHSGEICLILATRGRPKSLQQVFQALKTTTAQPDSVSLWIYVDEDDAATLQAIENGSLNDAGVRIHWHIGPQTSGLCETQNALWSKSGKTAELYMILADDVCFGAFGWDNVLRKTAQRHPNGIFLAGPYDPTSADTCTYPIFGWRWLETLQQIFAGYFPYWYDDRWVHQIGEMAGCYERLPLDLHPVNGKGKTRRMRDLPFWARFFQLTLPEREAAARKLIAAMNLDSHAKEASDKNLEKLAMDFKGQQDKFSDLYAVFQEERFTMHTPEERRAFNPKHFEKEAQAVAHLMQIGQTYISEKKFEEALKCVDATFMSNIQLRQARDLKAQCLRALGRESEAVKFERQTLVSWPEMNHVRRLFRFLGMVASDGKTMVLGFLQKRGSTK